MRKTRTNNLWSIKPQDPKYDNGDLWVVASTFKTAISKARRWLHRNGYKVNISAAKSSGTIDVF